MQRTRKVLVWCCLIGFGLANTPAMAQLPPPDAGEDPLQDPPTKLLQKSFKPVQSAPSRRRPVTDVLRKPKPNAKESPDPLYDFKRATVQEDDDELTRLLKERYNAAVGETEARMAAYTRGLTSVDAICASAMRVLIAERELIDDPKRMAQSHAKFVQLAKRIESFSVANLNAGTGTQQEVFQARYLRLDAEIAELRFWRSLRPVKDSKAP